MPFSPVVPNVTETQSDVFTANGWVMHLPSAGVTSPNFQRLDGLDREVEQVEVADGGSGLIRKFHGGIVRYSDITLVRVRDGSANDKAMSEFVDKYFTDGKKVDGVFIKYHHGTKVRTINFLGLSPKKETWPSYDNTAANREEMSYAFSCDYYQEIFE